MAFARTTNKLSSNVSYVSYDNDHPVYWVVKKENQSSLLIEYCNRIENGANFCIHEIKRESGPIHEVLTLRYDCGDSDDEGWDCYRSNFVLTFALLLQESIDLCYIMQCKETQPLTVVIEESPSYEILDERRIAIVRLAFHMPYIRTDHKFYYETVQQVLIRKLIDGNVISMLDKQPLDKWEESLSSFHDKTQVMIGSSYEPGGQPTEVSHVFRRIQRADYGTDNTATYDVCPSQAFVVHYHQFLPEEAGIELLDLRAEDLIEIDKKPYYELYYPIYCSVNYAESTVAINPECIQRRLDQSKFDLVEFVAECENYRIPSELSICMQLCEMIGRSRYFNESSWLSIGRALASACYPRSMDGLAKWRQLTEAALNNDPMPKFMKKFGDFSETLIQHYTSDQPSRTTYRTLVYFAMLDSPIEYNAWEYCWNITGVLNMTSLGESDIAQGLWRLLFNTHIKTPTCWYFFNGNNLVKSTDNVRLSIDIRHSIDYAEDLAADLSKEIRNHANTQLKERALFKHSKILNVIVKMRSSLKVRATKTCPEYFTCPDLNLVLHRMIDTNPMLFGVPNGILEVVGDELVFRPGKFEDYVSKISPTAYRVDYNPDKLMSKRLDKWISQLFPDEEIRHFALKYYSSILMKGNREKMGMIAIGPTNGGKTSWHSLIEHMLGHELCGRYPSNHFSVKKSQNGGATPEEEAAKGVNLIIVEEVVGTIDGNKLKEELGGASQSRLVRGLYRDPTKVGITHKMIICVNHINVICGIDAALIMRIYPIPFMTQYVSPDIAPATEAEQIEKRIFPMDINLVDIMPDLHQALLWKLAQYFPYYRREGLGKPRFVRDMLRKHISDSDPFTRYSIDRIKAVEEIYETIEDAPSLAPSELFDDYRIWHRSNCPNNYLPNIFAFESAMSRDDILGPLDERRRWPGYMMQPRVNDTPANDIQDAPEGGW